MAASSELSECQQENVSNAIIVQFFEMVPLRRMKWQSDCVTNAELDMDRQRQLLHSTVSSDLCKQYPPSINYQRAFVKKLLQTLEDYGVEMCDEIYEVYSELLQHKDSEDDSLCYKTYTIDANNRVMLQESVNMISFGTTGLNTWQAAQHLAEWAIQNHQLLDGRNILELGSGLGLTGITVCKQCVVKAYTFTDCHSQVLYLLARNIQLNFSDNSVPLDSADMCNSHDDDGSSESRILKRLCRKLSLKSENKSIDGDEEENDNSDLTHIVDTETVSMDDIEGDMNDEISTDLRLSPLYWDDVEDCDMNVYHANNVIRLARLNWETINDCLIQQLHDTDVILAADVVYDKRIIPALVTVLKTFLHVSADRPVKPCAYLASTIRNEDTRDQFLIAMSAEGLHYEQVEPPAIQIFHYDRSIPIEVLKITDT